MKATNTAVILVVDNDPAVRQYLAHVIEGAGHTCVTARSGGQALGEWQERSFDLVVTDLNMPNGDGLALADALMRMEAVPIVFITGFKDGSERSIKRFKDATILEKPFDSDDLLRLIDAKLAGKAVGDDGRSSAADGRSHWQGSPPEGLGGSGAWREGFFDPRQAGGGGDDDDALADEDTDNPGLK
jgi:CheY-like chemotaxis protein